MEQRTVDLMQRTLKRRYAAERRFRIYGILSIAVALLFMLFLFTAIIGKGHKAFVQAEVRLSVHLDASEFPSSPDDTQGYMSANYTGMIKQSLRNSFPDVTSRGDKRALYQLVSPGAGYTLRDLVLEKRGLVGTDVELWLPADDDVDMYVKGHYDGEENTSRPAKRKTAWLDKDPAGTGHDRDEF